jgi:hypothetical protein
LIEDGADLFGHSSMVAAVAAQARQDELSAMDAMGAVEQPYHEPGLADRQRRNLEQFDDARELVDAWRGGNVSWDYGAWGPDPDDPRCLISDDMSGGGMVVTADHRSLVLPMLSSPSRRSWRSRGRLLCSATSFCRYALQSMGRG